MLIFLVALVAFVVLWVVGWPPASLRSCAREDDGGL